MSATFTSPLVDPLPRRYITAQPGVGGRMKVRASDFLVEELPLYELSGEGEHVYLFVESEELAHSEMMQLLGRHFDLKESAIGWAGMKDRQAITRQLVSLHLPGREPTATPITDDRLRILWMDRHANKLRRGHLAGNRFSIRIRDVDPWQVRQVHAQLRELERRGVPAFFDAQRFGINRNNQWLGLHLIGRRWQAFIDELLGPHEQAEDAAPIDIERRELYAKGEWREALALWPRRFLAERAVLEALARGARPQQAVYRVPRSLQQFHTSAFQSAVFNHMIAQRLTEDGDAFGVLREGDLAFRHDRGPTFEATAERLQDEGLQREVQTLAVSPSGPLWGRDMRRASGGVDRSEIAALEAAGVSLEEFLAARSAPTGDRRPMRMPIRNIEIESGVDEHGPFIRTAFDLPRGAYATIVMRELMKSDEQHGEGEHERDDDAHQA